MNLDPHQAREATVWLDLPALGLDWGTEFTVTDELSGESYRWGQANYVRLDPSRPAHIYTVRPGIDQPIAAARRSTSRERPPTRTRDMRAVTRPDGRLSVDSRRAGTRPVLVEEPRDPQWYKRAVFYEVLIRGFADSNGDGTGDLRGLTSRLDYLQWLGIDCIWLLPIYASPLRDGGYDITTS